jgi:alkyl hydroperoxide reductase subunit AhpC
MATPISDEGRAQLAQQSILRIGDIAPNFKADTQLGEIDFYQYIGEGNWAILFSHPADFTPVCTTELGRVAQLKDQWAKRNVKVMALSVDSAVHHKEWCADIENLTKNTVNYPIIADEDRKISLLYGMLDASHIAKTGLPYTVRSVFIIDPSHIIRTIISYPAPTGRNFDEILRVVDSLQLAFSHKVATPADWNRGKDTLVLPTVSTAEAKELFPKGVNELRPWYRVTPDPSV